MIMMHGYTNLKFVVLIVNCVVLFLIVLLLLLIVLFYVLFVCKCVLYYCHGMSIQLQLTNTFWYSTECLSISS
jgi:hypothetical protein